LSGGYATDCGFQRIRGLAGSGKTVVLAMKAALTHLRDQDSTIVYTFYTKSLYQHIQRLITRFYRQFDDKDPDWSKIKIMHGWGGYSGEGVYFNACLAHNASPVTLREANRVSSDPFDYACTQLLKSTEILPLYDYIFVDEGQDFPASFIKLCVTLAKQNRVVFAYDDLQTIFQPTAPAIKDIIGTDKHGNPLVDLNEDVVLDKCYRNPREILVCAHALGFGIYGRIAQMLENKEQWEDIGYKVHQGNFTAGSFTEIERPAVNSLTTISENQSPDEIVKAFDYASFDEEVSATVQSIRNDLAEGLRPEDILVITVDDRFAKNYLRAISEELASFGIRANNIHEDSYGIRDFHKDGNVTLSTVHKAKGNEAFMVYVVGVDALYKSFAGPRERNVLFTAMTRAKGWVRVSGLGQGAIEWKSEIGKALNEFPYLRFHYPSQEQIKVIKRDLAEKAVRKHRAERKLDEILEVLTPEEIKRFMEQRTIKKGN
jgi:superfamily I DNA and RNA helicase